MCFNKKYLYLLVLLGLFFLKAGAMDENRILSYGDWYKKYVENDATGSWDTTYWGIEIRSEEQLRKDYDSYVSHCESDALRAESERLRKEERKEGREN